MSKIMKNGPQFREIPKKEYLFLLDIEWPLKMCMGFETQAAHPVETKSELPPPTPPPPRVWMFLYSVGILPWVFHYWVYGSQLAKIKR